MFFSWLEGIMLHVLQLYFHHNIVTYPMNYGNAASRSSVWSIKNIANQIQNNCQNIKHDFETGLGMCELHASFGVFYLNGYARCTWKNLN